MLENEVIEKLTQIIVFHKWGSLPKLSSQWSNSLEPWGKKRGHKQMLWKKKKVLLWKCR